MRQKLIILASLIGICGFFIYLSCCDDCPTCPGEPVAGSYYVFLTDENQDPPYYIWVVNSGTDSLIDSLPTPDQYINCMDIAPDGKYLATFAPDLSGVLIYDAELMDSSASISPSGRPFFTPDNQYLLLTSFGPGVINKYSVPDWSFVASDTMPFEPRCLFKTKPYIVGSIDGKEYYIYDYESMTIIKKDSLLRPDGTAPQAIEFEISSDDKFLYFSARPDKIFKFEIETDSIVDSIFIAYGAYHGEIKCTPDGKYIIFAESTDWPDQMIGNLFIIDQASFTMYRRIPTWGLYPDMPSAPQLPGRVAITPDCSKVYSAKVVWYSLQPLVFNLWDLSVSYINGLPPDCSSRYIVVGRQIEK